MPQDQAAPARAWRICHRRRSARQRRGRQDAGRTRSAPHARRRPRGGAHRDRDSGAPIRDAGHRRRHLRAAVRPAHRHLARHRRRRPDHRPQHEQRRAGRSRPARGPSHARARADAGRRAPDLARVSPQGRARRHAQLPADRPDQHVREPRVAADRDAGRVHDLQPREVPQRRRRRRDPAQQGLRLLRRLEHRRDAAHAVELRDAPERRRRDLHRAGLREDQPHGGREVPAAGAHRSRTPRRPLRHPGNRRHAGRHRPRPAGSGGDAAGDQRHLAHRGRHARAVARREVRRVRRLLGAVGQPGAGPCRRPAGAKRRHRADHRGAGVLRRRTHPGATRQGPRDRRSGLRDGGLVQGIRVEVRHRAQRESEPRQRRRRAAEHHDQVARRHRQGRHDSRRRRRPATPKCPRATASG